MRIGLRLYISDQGVGSIADPCGTLLCIKILGNKNFPKENRIIILIFQRHIESIFRVTSKHLSHQEAIFKRDFIEIKHLNELRFNYK